MDGLRCRALARPFTLAILFALAPAAHAHDTWFAPATAANDALELGTGNRFPVTESAVDPVHFVRAGCVARDGAASTLDLIRFTDTTTLLAARAGATTCFAQLAPFEIELPADKIAIYFREIRPSKVVVGARAAQAAQGVPFRERFTKNARIELDPAGATRAAGTTMDVLRTAPAGAVMVGNEATFQVLREGQPLADFPVELVNERSPLGLWFRTDGDGRVTARVPLAGRWILRGTDLRPSGDRWESQFVTYAFEVR